MIGLLTKVQILDNTGAVEARCIKVLRPHAQKATSSKAHVGDIILVSLTKTLPAQSKVLKGQLHKALVVRTKSRDPNNVSWDHNAAILVQHTKGNPDLTPLGSRFKGPISAFLKYKQGCQKIVSLAKYFI